MANSSMKTFYKKLIQNKNKPTENVLSSDEEKWLDAFDEQINKENPIDIRLLSKKQRARYLQQLRSKEALQKSSTEDEPKLLQCLPINNDDNLLSSSETDNEDEEHIKAEYQKYVTHTKCKTLFKFSKKQILFAKDKEETLLEPRSPKDYISINSSSSDEHITIKSSSSENKDKNINDLAKSDSEKSYEHEELLHNDDEKITDATTSLNNEDTHEPLVSNHEEILSSGDEDLSPKNTQIPMIFSARGKQFIRNYIYFCSRDEDYAYDADDESSDNEDEDSSLEGQYKITVRDFALERNVKKDEHTPSHDDKNSFLCGYHNPYRPLTPEISSSEFDYVTTEDENNDKSYSSSGSETNMLSAKEKRIYALLENKENVDSHSSKNEDKNLPSVINESLVENVPSENKCPEENLSLINYRGFTLSPCNSEKSFKSANSGSSDESVLPEEITISSGGKFIPKDGKYFRSGGKYLPSQHIEQDLSNYPHSDTEDKLSPSKSECSHSKSTISYTNNEKSYIFVSPLTSFKSALSGDEDHNSFHSVLSENITRVSSKSSSSDESETEGPESITSECTKSSISVKSSDESFHSISSESSDESNSNNQIELKQSNSACSLANLSNDKIAENIAVLLKVEVPKQERFFTLHSGQRVKFKSADNAGRIARLIEYFKKARYEDELRKAKEKKNIEIKPNDTPSTSKIVEHVIKIPRPRCCIICGKEKKYVCPKTNVALCSLECYKENLARQEDKNK